MSACKLTTNIDKDKLPWAIFLVSVTVTVIIKSEAVWILLGAGVLVWLVRAPLKRWFGGTVNDFAARPVTCARRHRLGQARPDWRVLRVCRELCVRQRARDHAVSPWRRGPGVAQLIDRQFVDAVAVAMINLAAAAIGTITGAVIVTGQRAIID